MSLNWEAPWISENIRTAVISSILNVGIRAAVWEVLNSQWWPFYWLGNCRARPFLELLLVEPPFACAKPDLISFCKIRSEITYWHIVISKHLKVSSGCVSVHIAVFNQPYLGAWRALGGHSLCFCAKPVRSACMYTLLLLFVSCVQCSRKWYSGWV